MRTRQGKVYGILPQKEMTSSSRSIRRGRGFTSTKPHSKTKIRIGPAAGYHHGKKLLGRIQDVLRQAGASTPAAIAKQVWKSPGSNRNGRTYKKVKASVVAILNEEGNRLYSDIRRCDGKTEQKRSLLCRWYLHDSPGISNNDRSEFFELLSEAQANETDVIRLYNKRCETTQLLQTEKCNLQLEQDNMVQLRKQLANLNERMKERYSAIEEIGKVEETDSRYLQEMVKRWSTQLDQLAEKL